MTIVPEHLSPDDEEALKLIGAIAVESARLEAQLYGLRDILRGHHSEKTDYSESHNKVAKNCRKLAEQLKNVLTDEVADGIGKWAMDASELLYQRGDLMHSTWILGDTGVMSLHLRTRNTKPVDRNELEGLLERIRAHIELGPVAWLYAVLGSDIVAKVAEVSADDSLATRDRFPDTGPTDEQPNEQPNSRAITDSGGQRRTASQRGDHLSDRTATDS